MWSLWQGFSVANRNLDLLTTILLLKNCDIGKIKSHLFFYFLILSSKVL